MANPQRIDIEANQPVKSDRGEEVETWVKLYECVPAKVMPQPSREKYDEDQKMSFARLLVKIRHLPNVTSKHRIVWRDIPYRIIGDPVDVDSRGRDMELNLERVT